ncbi:MAG: transglutaminase family protein [Acidimicrobiia bacterium]|jgi:transglutaminase-like putative cysteine protease
MAHVDDLLRATRYLDFDEPSVAGFADRVVGDAVDPTVVATRLFEAVRDEIRYDPYRISLAPDEMTASACLRRGYGFCVPKAVLLAAVARSRGIPARLGFADVRNHLSTPKLLEQLGTDLFLWHGYVELSLDDRWLKTTPAFNRSLCERFGVLPLEFDGKADALLHPFDSSGRRHMEYVGDHGTFDDLPLERITAAYAAAYPAFDAIDGDFAAEARPGR